MADRSRWLPLLCILPWSGAKAQLIQGQKSVYLSIGTVTYLETNSLACNGQARLRAVP
jgi:hypothetical protein